MTKLIFSCAITVLCDNLAGASCGGEHGLSLWIEADKKLLFDAGPSDLFLKNARKLKINPDDVEIAMLSHGHWDHGNGFLFLQDKTLFCHPDVFIPRFRKNNDVNIGLHFDKVEAERRFKLILSREPKKLSPQIIYLGEIPRIIDFESKTTRYEDELGNPDFVPDETALAIDTPNGLVVVTGCSHAGICNILEHAVKVSGNKKIYAVIGGFHLKAANEVTRKTIQYFKEKQIKRIYPMHCTSFPALFKFYEAFRVTRIQSGATVYF